LHIDLALDAFGFNPVKDAPFFRFVQGIADIFADIDNFPGLLPRFQVAR
jgi:hypothetical protein